MRAVTSAAARAASSARRAALLRAPRRGMADAARFPTETLRQDVKEALWRAQAVCFDVDSTVVTVEGIDELAAHAGKKDAVAALTQQ